VGIHTQHTHRETRLIRYVIRPSREGHSFLLVLSPPAPHCHECSECAGYIRDLSPEVASSGYGGGGYTHTRVARVNLHTHGRAVCIIPSREGHAFLLVPHHSATLSG